MPRPLIAVIDSPFPSLDPAKAALARLDPELRMAKRIPDDITGGPGGRRRFSSPMPRLPGELLRQLARCKVIGRFGLGVDNIDIKTAVDLGITVTYVPDYCMHEVSDHAMALLLAVARKIPFSNKLVQAGRWEMPAVVPIHRLAGRVLGLVGLQHPAPLAPRPGLRATRGGARPFVGRSISSAASGRGFRGLLAISTRLHPRAANAGDRGRSMPKPFAR
jgi:D-3-phosphoglycerate dehydrogenase